MPTAEKNLIIRLKSCSGSKHSTRYMLAYAVLSVFFNEYYRSEMNDK